MYRRHLPDHKLTQVRGELIEQYTTVRPLKNTGADVIHETVFNGIPQQAGARGAVRLRDEFQAVEGAFIVLLKEIGDPLRQLPEDYKRPLLNCVHLGIRESEIKSFSGDHEWLYPICKLKMSRDESRGLSISPSR